MILFNTKDIKKKSPTSNLLLDTANSINNEKNLNLLKFKILMLKLKKIPKSNTKILHSKNNSSLKINTTIVYSFVVSFTGSNIFINVYDLKTKKNLKTVTLGSYQIKKKTDKTAKKYFLLQLLITSFLKLEKYKPISINFLGVNLMFNKFIINVLKKKFIIKSIKLYNLIPHNGCRPRKKRRK